MAQGKRRDGTGRGRGRPPGRHLPFTSEEEAETHLLQRGFTQEQLRVLVEVGFYADQVSTLMGAFKKDEAGTWLLKSATSNLLMRNKPDAGDNIVGMFGSKAPATVTQYLGPLAEAFTVIAQPVVLLIQLQKAVIRARDLTRSE